MSGSEAVAAIACCNPAVVAKNSVNDKVPPQYLAEKVYRKNRIPVKRRSHVVPRGDCSNCDATPGSNTHRSNGDLSASLTNQPTRIVADVKGTCGDRERHIRPDYPSQKIQTGILASSVGSWPREDGNRRRTQQRYLMQGGDEAEASSSLFRATRFDCSGGGDNWKNRSQNYNTANYNPRQRRPRTSRFDNQFYQRGWRGKDNYYIGGSELRFPQVPLRRYGPEALLWSTAVTPAGTGAPTAQSTTVAASIVEQQQTPSWEITWRTDQQISSTNCCSSTATPTASSSLLRLSLPLYAHDEVNSSVCPDCELLLSPITATAPPPRESLKHKHDPPSFDALMHWLETADNIPRAPNSQVPIPLVEMMESVPLEVVVGWTQQPYEE